MSIKGVKLKSESFFSISPVYKIKMRGTLGCAVFIFGRKLITPAMKQLIAHTGYYNDQAKADAQLAELPWSRSF